MAALPNQSLHPPTLPPPPPPPANRCIGPCRKALRLFCGPWQWNLDMRALQAIRLEHIVSES